jgi:methionyl aminopeptidase
MRPVQTFTKVHSLFPVTARLSVPSHIIRPPYVINPNAPYVNKMGDPVSGCIKSEIELPSFRRACRLASRARSFAGSLVRPGITPDEIDRRTHEFIIQNGGYPSPLGFPGAHGSFPKSICSSINQVVVHGIPDTRPLEDGDIVNFDVSTYVEGFHGDCSGTFLVGNVDEAGKRLVEVTRQSLVKAVSICAPGVPFAAIGYTIEKFVAPYFYGVVQSFTGHGIGRDFHVAPAILHHLNTMPGVMQKNMTFTIEPAINEGSDPGCKMLSDGWTYVTNDGLRSAQVFHDIVDLFYYLHNILFVVF